MVILLHVTIAIISVIETTMLLLRPTKTKLMTTYALFGLTLLTGTYLLLTYPTHMVETCTMGILYVAFGVSGITIAQRRLAQKNNILETR